MATDTITEPMLPIGTRLHDYEIKSVLGVGGFGITYLVEHCKLGNKYAIKEYMPQDFSRRASNLSVVPVTSRSWTDDINEEDLFNSGLQRFLKEAKDLIRFDHPNIVRAHNYFEDHGTGYIVMEYVRGETLRRWLEERTEPVYETILRNIFLPVLDGLAEVHQHGLLHRDIKPENIYLRMNGTPLLLDFGTARDTLSTNNRTKHIVVTSGYSPKEQYATDGMQGPWTDIYAVGGTLYRCIYGESPPNVMDRIMAVDNGKVDPIVKKDPFVENNYSASILDTVGQCMELNARDRLQSATDVSLGLVSTDSTRVMPSGIQRPNAGLEKNVSKDSTRIHPSMHSRGWSSPVKSISKCNSERHPVTRSPSQDEPHKQFSDQRPLQTSSLPEESRTRMLEKRSSSYMSLDEKVNADHEGGVTSTSSLSEPRTRVPPSLARSTRSEKRNVSGLWKSNSEASSDGQSLAVEWTPSTENSGQKPEWPVKSSSAAVDPELELDSDDWDSIKLDVSERVAADKKTTRRGKKSSDRLLVAIVSSIVMLILAGAIWKFLPASTENRLSRSMERVDQLEVLIGQSGTRIGMEDRETLDQKKAVTSDYMEQGETSLAATTLEEIQSQLNKLYSENARRFTSGTPVNKVSLLLSLCEKDLGVGSCTSRWFESESAIDEMLIPFKMDKAAVSFEQFSDFVKSTDHLTVAEQRDFSLQQLRDFTIAQLQSYNWKQPEGEGSTVDDFRKHPVVHVSFYDAQAYCAYKNARLPTRAEWEYVATVGAVVDSTVGENGIKPAIIGSIATGKLYSLEAKSDNLLNKISGAFGMGGNVWEWTTTPDSRYIDEPVVYVKGGSWNERTSTFTRLGALRSEYALDSHIDIGFRCVSDVDIWPY